MSSLIAVLVAGMVVLARGHHYETLKVVAAAVSSLVATIAGAFLAFWFALLQIQEQTRTMNKTAEERRSRDETLSRQQLAFEMHREFSSENILRARTEASVLLEEHPGKSYAELYRLLPEARTRPLFIVVEFYDRLALAVSYHRVDLLLVPKLFGAYFLWWWTDAFEQRLVAEDPDWPEHARIQRLRDWFEAFSDPADYAKWCARASGKKLVEP